MSDLDLELVLKSVFKDIEQSDFEIGESMVFVEVPENQMYIQETKDKVDELLAEEDMDEHFTAVSRKTNRLIKGNNPHDEELKRIEDGNVGIGIERIN